MIGARGTIVAMTDPYQQNNINSQYPVRSRTVDSDGSANYDDDLVIFNAEVTFTLASANQRQGQNIYLKASSLVGGNVTIIPQAGDSIDGLASLIISGAPGAQQSVILKSDGVSDWRIVGCCDDQPAESCCCANTVTVSASDPFSTLPAPSGSGQIILDPDTFYLFCGPVDLGDAYLVSPGSSVISGKDPLVDSITSSATGSVALVNMLGGGTVRDIALIFGGDTALSFQGSQGLVNCVAWNLSIAAIPGGSLLENGINLLGFITNFSISRIQFSGCINGIKSTPSGPVEPVGQIQYGFVSEVSATSPQDGSRLINLETPGLGLSVISTQYITSGASDVGIDISRVWESLRFTNCGYFDTFSSTPSIIAQTAPLPTATTGTAIQSEAAGCIGFTNSKQSGAISVFQDYATGLDTVVGAASTYVPVGTGTVGHPPYSLDAPANRVSLDVEPAGSPAEAQFQVIRFNRIQPYSGNISVAVSIAISSLFFVAPRQVAAQIRKYDSAGGSVVLSGRFQGSTPGALLSGSANISFSVPVELEQGDAIQVEIANLTDNASLIVTGVRVSIS